MRKKISYGILFCCLLGILFFIRLQWQELNRFSNQAGLRFEEGGLSVQQIEDYYAREEESVQITAWEMTRGQTIACEEMGGRTQGTVIKLHGSMARVLPFPIKYGSIAFYEDTSGCVISSSLAWKLFRAENVIGKRVYWEEKEWIIRGILDMEEPLLTLYQQKKQERMPYVELWSIKEPPVVRLEQIKGSLGLFEDSYVFSGSFYCSIARLCISLPFWILFFYGWKTFSRWSRNTERKQKDWIQAAGIIFLIIIFSIGFYHSISFTSDFVPSRWSDFDFWKEKGGQIIEEIRQKKQFPEIYWEQQMIMRVRRIAAGAVIMAAITFKLSRSSF